MDVNELIDALEKATYTYTSGNNEYTSSLISGNRAHDLLKKVVYEWERKQEETKTKIRIAELEAKVYTYEQIIANSNFAPVLIPRGYIQPLNEVPTKENSTN